MGLKVIAVGNRMMGDDGIALCVAEQLLDSLIELGIEVIVGETDVDYCISRIRDRDELIIIDGSCSGEALGSVSSMSLLEAVEHSNVNSWQHDRDLIKELKIRQLKVSGLLLCIEVSDIDFRYCLSTKLQQGLPEICREIYDIIIKYRGELENA